MTAERENKSEGRKADCCQVAEPHLPTTQLSERGKERLPVPRNTVGRHLRKCGKRRCGKRDEGCRSERQSLSWGQRVFLYSSTTQNSWVLRIEITNCFLSIPVNKSNTDYLLCSISCRLPRTHTKIPEFSRCSNCHKAMVLDNYSRPRACSSLSSLTHLLLPPHHTVTPHLPTMPEALGACRFTTGFRNDRVFLKSQRSYHQQQ